MVMGSDLRLVGSPHPGLGILAHQPVNRGPAETRALNQGMKKPWGGQGPRNGGGQNPRGQARATKGGPLKIQQSEKCRDRSGKEMGTCGTFRAGKDERMGWVGKSS